MVNGQGMKMDIAAQKFFDKAREILKVEKPEPFGVFWNAADYKTRLALLRLTGEAVYLNNRRWEEISAEARATIKRRAGELKDWLNKVLGVETCRA